MYRNIHFHTILMEANNLYLSVFSKHIRSDDVLGTRLLGGGLTPFSPLRERLLDRTLAGDMHRRYKGFCVVSQMLDENVGVIVKCRLLFLYLTLFVVRACVCEGREAVMVSMC